MLERKGKERKEREDYLIDGEGGEYVGIKGLSEEWKGEGVGEWGVERREIV